MNDDELTDDELMDCPGSTWAEEGTPEWEAIRERRKTQIAEVRERTEAAEARQQAFRNSRNVREVAQEQRPKICLSCTFYINATPYDGHHYCQRSPDGHKYSGLISDQIVTPTSTCDYFQFRPGGKDAPHVPPYRDSHSLYG